MGRQGMRTGPPLQPKSFMDCLRHRPLKQEQPKKRVLPMSLAQWEANSSEQPPSVEHTFWPSMETSVWVVDWLLQALRWAASVMAMLFTNYPSTMMLILASMMLGHVVRQILWILNMATFTVNMLMWPVIKMGSILFGLLAVDLGWKLRRTQHTQPPQAPTPAPPPATTPPTSLADPESEEESSSSSAPETDLPRLSELEMKVKETKFEDEIVGFGAHKGWWISEVCTQKPTYALWCLKNAQNTTSNQQMIRIRDAVAKVGDETFWKNVIAKTKAASDRQQKLQEDRDARKLRRQTEKEKRQEQREKRDAQRRHRKA